MKSGKLAEFVQSTSYLLDWAESRRAVEVVNVLFTALAKNPKRDLKIVALLSEGEPASPVAEGQMSIKKLLDSISLIQRASGAGSSAKSVSELNDIIANDISVEQFASNVENFDLVASLVARLNEASGSREAFESVMTLIERKGILTKAQACTIAHKYAGGPKPKTLEQAISTIRSKFSADQLFLSKTA